MTRKGSTGPSQRQLRVGEALRHALAEILARGGLHDPELADLQATVTEVRMSPDLRAATAFIVPFGGGDAEALAKALNRAEIIRALIDGLIDSGLDVTASGSEADLRAKVARRLGTPYR